jgi:predicted acyl esterase
VLWENIPAGVPKRISISTGQHNPNDPLRTKKDWLDCWVVNHGDATSSSALGHPCAVVMDPAKRVLLSFESQGADRLQPYVSTDWPLPETAWTRFSLCANGTLSQTTGGACDGQTRYLSTGPGRHVTGDAGHAAGSVGPVNPYDQAAPYGFTTGLPDTARYTLNFNQTTAIAGPIDVTLYASTTSADVDFWAEVLDRDAATGATTFVQRGLLRASFNATFDAAKSQRTPTAAIYRPYYAYSGLTPVIPAQVNKYEVEVFPLGHVWRPGHQLVLQLHAPPASDPISTYAYEPNQPGVVTIVQDVAHPTSILLPFMPTLPPIRSSAPACGAVVGEVCVTPQLG